MIKRAINHFFALLKGPTIGLGTIPQTTLLKKYGNNFITVNGTSIHYKESGSRGNQTIILLHGIYASLHTWDDWVLKLQKNYHVIAIDLPGFAFSGELEDYSDKSYSDFILSFMDTMKIDKASFVGSSLGGLVSWVFATRHPSKTNKLILVDPAAFPIRPPFIVKLGASKLFGIFNQLISPRLLSAVLMKIYICGDKMPSLEIITRYQDIIRQKGYMKRSRKVFKAITSHCYKCPQELSKITSPTLIMWGERDRLIPFSHTKLWKKEVPHAKIVTYPGVGHLPHEEAPEIAFNDLSEFLRN